MCLSMRQCTRIPCMAMDTMEDMVAVMEDMEGMEDMEDTAAVMEDTAAVMVAMETREDTEFKASTPSKDTSLASNRDSTKASPGSTTAPFKTYSRLQRQV